MAFSSGCEEKALPFEVVEHICSFLSIRDILRLSALNSFWRNVTNSDYIWKRLCILDFQADPSQKAIIERACRVRPAFQIPNNKSSNLTSVCDWRIRYAQEVYVANNWRKKRFHVEDLPKENKITKKIAKDFGFRCKQKAYYIFGDLILIDAKNKFLVSRITDEGIFPADPILIPPPLKKGQIFLLKSGFCVICKPFFLHYVLNGDNFELKVRSLIFKTPDIPFIMKESSIKEHVDSDVGYICSYSFQVNDRFLFASVRRTKSREFRSREPYKREKFYILAFWDLKDLKYISYKLEEEIQEVDIQSFYLAKGSSPLLYIVTDVNVILVHFRRTPVTTEILFEVDGYNKRLNIDSCITIDDSLLVMNEDKKMDAELNIVKPNGSVQTVQLSYINPSDDLLLVKCRFAIQVFAGHQKWELDKLCRFLHQEEFDTPFRNEIRQCQHVISNLIAISTIRFSLQELSDSGESHFEGSDSEDEFAHSRATYDFLLFDKFCSIHPIDYGRNNKGLVRCLSNSNKIVIVDKNENEKLKEVYFFY